MVLICSLSIKSMGAQKQTNKQTKTAWEHFYSSDKGEEKQTNKQKIVTALTTLHSHHDIQKILLTLMLFLAYIKYSCITLDGMYDNNKTM